MLAHATLLEGTTGLVTVLAALGTVLTALWKLSQTIGTYRREHVALMDDLKARTEAIEKATPGVTPIHESPEVTNARNGAEKR